MGGWWEEGFSGFVLIVFSNVVMNFIPYTLSHVPCIIQLVLMVLIRWSTMCSEDLPHVLLLSDLLCILFPIASHFSLFVQSPTFDLKLHKSSKKMIASSCGAICLFNSEVSRDGKISF